MIRKEHTCTCYAFRTRTKQWGIYTNNSTVVLYTYFFIFFYIFFPFFVHTEFFKRINTDERKISFGFVPNNKNTTVLSYIHTYYLCKVDESIFSANSVWYGLFILGVFVFVHSILIIKMEDYHYQLINFSLLCQS